MQKNTSTQTRSYYKYPCSNKSSSGLSLHSSSTSFVKRRDWIGGTADLVSCFTLFANKTKEHAWREREPLRKDVSFLSSRCHDHEKMSAFFLPDAMTMERCHDHEKMSAFFLPDAMTTPEP
eukprot:1159018-Pelagomonas_calceolata.AAC.1